MRRLVIFFPLCVFLFFLNVSDVLADREAAEKAFVQGTAKFEQGEFAEAAALFRQAYKEQSTWKVQYNIGQCEAAAKHHGRAMEAFEMYLSNGGDEVPVERRLEVEGELDRLRRLVGFVEITAPAGAQLFIDDQLRGTAPLPGKLMVAASVIHTVKVVYNGSELLNREINVSGLQSIAVACGLPSEEGPRNGNEADANVDSATLAADHQGTGEAASDDNAHQAGSSDRSRLVPIGISLWAVGGAGLAAGIVTGALAIKKNNELRTDCQDGICPPAVHDENNAKADLVSATNILLATGSGMAVLGTVFFIVGKMSNKRKMPVAVTPFLGAQLAGITFDRSF